MSWGSDGAIRFWSLPAKGRAPLNSMVPSEASFGEMEGMLPVGGRIVSWNFEGAIRFWSPSGEPLPGGDARQRRIYDEQLTVNRERMTSWSNDDDSSVTRVLVAGDKLVSWGPGGAIRFWKLNGDRLPGGDDCAHIGSWGVSEVLFTGDRLVSWGDDGALRFWSTTGERLSGGSEDAHRKSVRGVLNTGGSLVTWGGDGAIRFWSLSGERRTGGLL